MIKMEQLYFSYYGLPPYILQNINLDIEAGDYVSVIGENGCGKTTLMKILLGFLKPTHGEIKIAANRIGYVPQKHDFTNAGFPITVWETMDSYRKLLKIKNRNIIEESLHLVGMDNFAKSLIGNLSGGQIQKIWIARAIMGNPELLILDEPSTGVDLDSQEEIYKILKDMNVNKKITILSVEHNLKAVFANSNKIYHIQNGQGHLCSPDQYAKEYLHLKEGNPYYASI